MRSAIPSDKEASLADYRHAVRHPELCGSKKAAFLRAVLQQYFQTVG
jgi:hypothetical protein